MNYSSVYIQLGSKTPGTTIDMMREINRELNTRQWSILGDRIQSLSTPRSDNILCSGKMIVWEQK